MEILHKFKENGYFTSELYHLLVKKKLVDPSEIVSYDFNTHFTSNIYIIISMFQ